MAFDKKLYAERREQNLRGQGDHYFTPRGFIYADRARAAAQVGGKPITKKALKKYTKRARELYPTREAAHEALLAMA